jgi:carboxylate-amine ligase
VFQKSALLTIGVECEFGIVDNTTYDPAHVGLEISQLLNNPFVHYELYKHMIEITTGVCSTIQQIEKDLASRINLITPELPKYHASMLGIGNLPLLMLEQVEPVETERYKILRETRKALYERFTTLGMHIHLGMPDTASCLRFHNFYMHLLPHILALSASSPFEFGKDTGLASIRPSVTESMPIAGLPYQFTSWQDYKDLCCAMARAGSITDVKDLWWDLRPCPRYGTLEIRICDQPATLAEVAAISAFVHCLGHWFAEHQQWLDEMPRPNNWRMRENKWRAMRFGLNADIVTNNNGDIISIKDDILQWVERLQPFYKKFGYRPYQAMLVSILEKGNSASRQRRVWQATNSLQAVYAHCIAELEHGSPLWERIDELEKNKEIIPIK